MRGTKRNLGLTHGLVGAVRQPRMKKLAWIVGSIAIVTCAVWSFAKPVDRSASWSEAATRSNVASPVDSDSREATQLAPSAERELPRVSAVPLGPTLVAVDALTGVTLANADVLWCAEPSWPLIVDELGQREEPLTNCTAALPTWLTTDGAGRCVLPATRERVHVRVYHGMLEGRATLAAAEPGEQRIALAPNDDLLVRVIGSDGAPQAGVPVRFRPNRTGEAFARTGPSGIARFRDSRRWIREHQRGLYLLVRCDVPFEEPPSVELADRSLDEPIDLRMPPTGSLTVRVGAAGERGLAERSRVTLGATRAGLRLSAVVRDGVARFPCVALGEMWYAELRGPGLAEIELPELRGPQYPREEVVVDVSARLCSWVALRVLTSDGRVATERELRFAFSRRDELGSSPDSAAMPATTDVDGDVRFVPPIALDTWLLVWSGARQDAVAVDLSRGFPIGETRLPDVKMLTP